MTTPTATLCKYGAHRGEYTYPLLDARGIYCALVCEYCEGEARKAYRPEIFTDPQYESDDPIEPEE